MQLKKALSTLGFIFGSTTLLAQPQVHRLDADTLLVELQYGKPPHGRMLIEREKDPEVFATFDEMRMQPRRKVFAGFFGGAPGKSPYPRPTRDTTVPTQETTEFAQFEEGTGSNADPVRHWHGAPGKHLPLR